jgi:hypothetical protein
MRRNRNRPPFAVTDANFTHNLVSSPDTGELSYCYCHSAQHQNQDCLGEQRALMEASHHWPAVVSVSREPAYQMTRHGLDSNQLRGRNFDYAYSFGRE